MCFQDFFEVVIIFVKILIIDVNSSNKSGEGLIRCGDSLQSNNQYSSSSASFAVIFILWMRSGLLSAF